MFERSESGAELAAGTSRANSPVRRSPRQRRAKDAVTDEDRPRPSPLANVTNTAQAASPQPADAFLPFRSRQLLAQAAGAIHDDEEPSSAPPRMGEAASAAAAAAGGHWLPPPPPSEEKAFAVPLTEESLVETPMPYHGGSDYRSSVDSNSPEDSMSLASSSASSIMGGFAPGVESGSRSSSRLGGAARRSRNRSASAPRLPRQNLPTGAFGGSFASAAHTLSPLTPGVLFFDTDSSPLDAAVVGGEGYSRPLQTPTAGLRQQFSQVHLYSPSADSAPPTFDFPESASASAAASMETSSDENADRITELLFRSGSHGRLSALGCGEDLSASYPQPRPRSVSRLSFKAASAAELGVSGGGLHAGNRRRSMSDSGFGGGNDPHGSGSKRRRSVARRIGFPEPRALGRSISPTDVTMDEDDVFLPAAESVPQAQPCSTDDDGALTEDDCSQASLSGQLADGEEEHQQQQRVLFGRQISAEQAMPSPDAKLRGHLSPNATMHLAKPAPLRQHASVDSYLGVRTAASAAAIAPGTTTSQFQLHLQVPGAVVARSPPSSAAAASHAAVGGCGASPHDYPRQTRDSRSSSTTPVSRLSADVRLARRQSRNERIGDGLSQSLTTTGFRNFDRRLQSCSDGSTLPAGVREGARARPTPMAAAAAAVSVGSPRRGAVAPPPRLERMNSVACMDATPIVAGEDELPLAQDVRGDRLAKCKLPTTMNAHSFHDEIRCISPSTMRDVLDGKFSKDFDQFVVVDCRFPYEFDGGHIRGALNLWTCEKTVDAFFQTPIVDIAGGDRVAIIFHCEFSSHRGPTQFKYLRDLDKFITMGSKGLIYPEMYVIEGGYKAFFGEYPEYCTPQSYLLMKARGFEQECTRHERILSCSRTTAAERRWENHGVIQQLTAAFRRESFLGVSMHVAQLEAERNEAAQAQEGAVGMSPRTPCSQMLA